MHGIESMKQTYGNMPTSTVLLTSLCIVLLFMLVLQHAQRPAGDPALLKRIPKALNPTLKKCALTKIGGNPQTNYYGAWPICLQAVGNNPIIYSFGIGTDISFDQSMIASHGAQVFGFDPTVSKTHLEAAQKSKGGIPDGFHLYEIGLGSKDGIMSFYRSRDPKIGSLVSTPNLFGYESVPSMKAPVLRLATISCMLGHPWIDILKIDVEGAEFDLILAEDFDVSNLNTNQILFEFHERIFTGGQQLRDRVYNKLRSGGFEPVEGQGNKHEVVFLRLH